MVGTTPMTPCFGLFWPLYTTLAAFDLLGGGGTPPSLGGGTPPPFGTPKRAQKGVTSDKSAFEVPP